MSKKDNPETTGGMYDMMLAFVNEAASRALVPVRDTPVDHLANVSAYGAQIIIRGGGSSLCLGQAQTVGAVDELVARAPHSPVMRTWARFNRELAAPDDDAATMRAIKSCAKNLRDLALRKDIKLNGDRWIDPAPLQPYAQRITSLFNNLAVTPVYRAWQAERSHSLAHSLAADPLFRDLTQDWHLADGRTLAHYARYVGERLRMTFAHGIAPAPRANVSTYSEGHTSKNSDKRLVRGWHRAAIDSDPQHDISYNTHNDAGFHHVATGLNVVFHENFHAVQAMLARAFVDGTIGRDHPLRTDARRLFLSGEERSSYIPGIRDTYRAHTLEEDAFRAADDLTAMVEDALKPYGITLAARERPVAFLPAPGKAA